VSPFSIGIESTSAAGSSSHHQRRAPVFGSKGLAESLARRALRGGETRDGEPGMTLKSDDELLARDTRGADDTNAKIPAHEVTSKAVGVKVRTGAKAHRPRGEPSQLTLSTLRRHEPAHLTVGGGNVKQPRHGAWMVLQVMCYDYWARADDFWKESYPVDEESVKCELPSFR
jgi:hypothetical protein